MKAYAIRDKDGYSEFSSVVYAENRSKAIVTALCTDTFGDFSFTELRAKRVPKLDSLYRGYREADWNDPEVRTILVRDYGWRCVEPEFGYCKECPCKECCGEWEQMLEEME